MTGQAHWLTLGVLLVGGLGVYALWRWMNRVAPPARLLWRRIHCPGNGAVVDCCFVQQEDGGRLVNVRRCSRFDPPDQIDCGRHCVHCVQPDA